MAHLKKVDHVTYACEKGSIERWAWFHIEVEGGTLINRIDDVSPDDPDSSMKLWCIDYGDFGVALVEGIDRAERSQVTRFVERHGDHSCQHVAFETRDLDVFTAHVERMGGSVRGPKLVRHDGFGVLEQLFARGYEAGQADEVQFPEYVQRPGGRAGDGAAITFAFETGQGFYAQISEAVTGGDVEPFFDFSLIPQDWSVPEPAPRAAAT